MRSLPLDLVRALADAPISKLRELVRQELDVDSTKLKRFSRGKLIVAILKEKYELSGLLGSDDCEAGRQLPTWDVGDKL